MPDEQKIEYDQLEVGYEFLSGSYKLDYSIVSVYLKAVENGNSLYQAPGLVPPMAVAAYALKALSEGMALPPGTIHISQEFEFLNTVGLNDSLTSYARVSRKQTRGKLHLLTVELNVSNQNREAVLAGTTSFMMPVLEENEGL